MLWLVDFHFETPTLAGILNYSFKGPVCRIFAGDINNTESHFCVCVEDGGGVHSARLHAKKSPSQI